MYVLSVEKPSLLSLNVKKEDSIKYNLTEVKLKLNKNKDEYIPIGYGFSTYHGKPCFLNEQDGLKYCWCDSRCVEITISKLNGDIRTYIRPARSEFYENLHDSENVSTLVAINKDGEVLVNGWVASKVQIREIIKQLMDLL